MVDIPGINNATQVSGQPSADKGVADPDMFLELLTTQLENQDPLNPQKPAEFTSQLAQFSSVEQSARTNEKLDDVISGLQRGAIERGLPYVGKTVEGESDTVAHNGEDSTNLRYTLSKEAEAVDIRISTPDGRRVATVEGKTEAGRNVVEWDGTDDAGKAVPEGQYKISVTAQDEDGNPVSSSTFVKGEAKEVTTDSSGSPVLVLAGGNRISPDDVESVSP